MSSSSGSLAQLLEKIRTLNRSWSITGRLTLLYTVLTSGLLVLLTSVLYFVMVDSLENENRNFLSDQVVVLTNVITEHPDSREPLVEEVHEQTSRRRFILYYARVLEGETLVAETPTMGTVAPISAFPQPREGAASTAMRKYQTESGQFFVLMSTLVPAGGPGSSPIRAGGPRSSPIRAGGTGFPLVPAGGPGSSALVLQLALNISQQEALLEKYRRNMVLVLLVGAAFSAASGALIARRGMRPIDTITRAAQNITASHLCQRIGSTPWPRELTTLVAEFDEMLSRLEESFNRLSQFSADLAHELRTPISNLMGEAEVALSRPRSREEYRQVLESSMEEYGRLAHVIDSLLFLARAEASREAIVVSPLEAHAEIAVICEFYESVAEERGITVIREGASTMYSDSVLFRRVISNLLSNALQHTPRGGEVTLRARTTSDNAVEIQVHDTGSGIDARDLPRIFDRFYRADRARSNRGQGTGLGLAMVKSIMELHNGSVTISSEPGQGTLVTLRFPPRGGGV